MNQPYKRILRFGGIFAAIHLALVMTAFALMALSKFNSEATMLWGIFIYLDYPISQLLFPAAKSLSEVFHTGYNYMLENVFIPLMVFGIFGTLQFLLLGVFLGAVNQVGKRFFRQ